MQSITRVLFETARKIARLGGGRWFRWLYKRTCAWLPMRRLSGTERLLVVVHPMPAYPFHALLIPKQAISGLRDLHPEQAGLFLEILRTAGRVAQENGVSSYRIVVNEGRFQDIPLLHFHLISDG
jgi:diadenosine tetraphosphate (Ap4A) HIT family hydrolase